MQITSCVFSYSYYKRFDDKLEQLKIGQALKSSSINAIEQKKDKNRNFEEYSKRSKTWKKSKTISAIYAFIFLHSSIFAQLYLYSLIKLRCFWIYLLLFL
jgi:hypothetical protein